MSRRHRYGNPDGNQEAIFDYGRHHLGAEIRNTTAVGRGFPDGVIGWRGLTVMAEVKRPGGKLRESQEDFRTLWGGGPIVTVTSGTDLFEQLVALDRRVPPVRGLPGQVSVDEAIAFALGTLNRLGLRDIHGRGILEDLVRKLNGSTGC